MLNKTNLVIAAAPLPVDFRGTVQVLFEEMVRRLSILSPSGTSFFVISATEPASNVGPWLNTSTDPAQWWVFSTTDGKYVPVDISASLPALFFIQAANPGTPGATDPLIWIRVNQDRIVGIYGWDGSAWQASANITHSGSTAQRPTVPVDLEEYFDTDINVLLRFERGAWRTAAGSPGDVKHVTHTILTEAKRYNPGWEVLGKDDQAQRGRFIGMAAKDPGATPESSFSTGTGITARAAGDQAGEETHVLLSNEHEPHTHEIGHAQALGSGKTAQFHRVEDADVFNIPSPAPPNHWKTLPLSDGAGAALGESLSGSAGVGPAGTKLITAPQYSKTEAASLTGTATAHNNVPQALFLWTLTKI